MSNIVIFVANGFNRKNVRLQPWRYVYELAIHKTKKNKVIIVTEGSTDASSKEWEEGFTVIETRLLSVMNQFILGKYLKSLMPQELWWSTTPRSIAFYPVLSKIDCQKIAFITCPLYRWRELIRATLSGVPYNETKALWSQRFVPRLFFRLLLNSSIFNYVIVQSKNNKNILHQNGVKKNRLYYLPVGIDNEDVKPVDAEILEQIRIGLDKKENEIIFLYFGALRSIRGFDSLLKAFPGVVKKNINARLVVLARGASDEVCRQLCVKLDHQGLGDNVSIIGGWLKREEVWSFIELSDIVVLPFVLVPSDIPIAVLESLARGKPVVVSPVDGLPELAQGRGVIVDPLKTITFSQKLYELSDDADKLTEYTRSANEFIKKYPRWDDVGVLMDNICMDYKQSKI